VGRASAGAMAQLTETERAAKRERRGLLSGAVMALGASLAFATARAGLLGGLGVADLIFVRFLVAAGIMLPVLVRLGLPDLAGIGVVRALILTVLSGAPFALLQTGGYAFAPLAHGAVIAPSTVTILSTVGAAVFLGERLSRSHAVGAGIVLMGIVLIGWDGLTARSFGDRVWLGDGLFFSSSVMLASFTLLLRYWRLSALRATAVVAVLSCLLATPIYVAWVGMEHLKSLPLVTMAFQGLMQGGVQGVVTMFAFGQAILLLGVSRAVLFPAIVPAVSVLVGIPIVGEIPSLLQISGLGVVTLGLLITIGLTRYFPIAIWRQ